MRWFVDNNDDNNNNKKRENNTLNKNKQQINEDLDLSQFGFGTKKYNTLSSVII